MKKLMVVSLLVSFSLFAGSNASKGYQLLPSDGIQVTDNNEDKCCHLAELSKHVLDRIAYFAVNAQLEGNLADLNQRQQEKEERFSVSASKQFSSCLSLPFITEERQNLMYQAPGKKKKKVFSADHLVRSAPHPSFIDDIEVVDFILKTDAIYVLQKCLPGRELLIIKKQKDKKVEAVEGTKLTLSPNQSILSFDVSADKIFLLIRQYYGGSQSTDLHFEKKGGKWFDSMCFPMFPAKAMEFLPTFGVLAMLRSDGRTKLVNLDGDQISKKIVINNFWQRLLKRDCIKDFSASEESSSVNDLVFSGTEHLLEQLFRAKGVCNSLTASLPAQEADEATEITDDSDSE